MQWDKGPVPLPWFMTTWGAILVLKFKFSVDKPSSFYYYISVQLLLYPGQIPSHPHRWGSLGPGLLDLLYANLSLRVCLPGNLTPSLCDAGGDDGGGGVTMITVHTEHFLCVRHLFYTHCSMQSTPMPHGVSVLLLHFGDEKINSQVGQSTCLRRSLKAEVKN